MYGGYLSLMQLLLFLGYAADGYARIKGVSALLTTYGVGELSAINAMAGSYAEYVPVIHIVGHSSTAARKQNLILHHSLGDGNHQAFQEMNRNISCALTELTNASTAPVVIDEIIRKCCIESRPVYIGLPSDMVREQVDATRLKVPIDTSIPPNDPKREIHVVDVILKLLQAANRPALLVDLLAIRQKVCSPCRSICHCFFFFFFVIQSTRNNADYTV